MTFDATVVLSVYITGLIAYLWWFNAVLLEGEIARVKNGQPMHMFKVYMHTVAYTLLTVLGACTSIAITALDETIFLSTGSLLFTFLGQSLGLAGVELLSVPKSPISMYARTYLIALGVLIVVSALYTLTQIPDSVSP